jgi:hypothetical protein
MIFDLVFIVLVNISYSCLSWLLTYRLTFVTTLTTFCLLCIEIRERLLGSRGSAVGTVTAIQTAYSEVRSQAGSKGVPFRSQAVSKRVPFRSQAGSKRFPFRSQAGSKRVPFRSQAESKRDCVRSQAGSKRDCVRSQAESKRDCVRSQAESKRDCVRSQAGSKRDSFPPDFHTVCGTHPAC